MAPHEVPREATSSKAILEFHKSKSTALTNVPEAVLENELVCAIKIKTRAADLTVHQTLPSLSSYLHVTAIGAILRNDLLLIEHQLQIVHQCLCTGLWFAFYVFATEAQVFYSVFIFVPHNLLDAAQTFMQEDGARIFEWAYKTPLVLPSFLSVNVHVWANGPINPTKLFHYSSQ